MIFDPLTRIYKSNGDLITSVPIAPGQTTIPRYRNDIQGFSYKSDDGVDYRLVPYIEFSSEPETIINASAIPFMLPEAIENPHSSVRSLGCALVNTTRQFGYRPGQWTSPVGGISLELQANEVLAVIDNGGVRIIRKNGILGEVSCSVDRWKLVVYGLFFIPQS